MKGVRQGESLVSDIAAISWILSGTSIGGDYQLTSRKERRRAVFSVLLMVFEGSNSEAVRDHNVARVCPLEEVSGGVLNRPGTDDHRLTQGRL